MMRELIINGQQVDLAPDTDITLEYVSNILGEVGKVSLSRSYTARLPRTLRNARALGSPDLFGHTLPMTRRFLPARYYRNGIDLLGEAQAYILRSTADGYEVALVWNTLEALQTLSQSDKTLNDLASLPVLTWVGSDGSTPNYATAATAGSDAFFARYESGLGAYRYPQVNAATHPCIRLSALLDFVLTEAGVTYELPADISALRETVLLAAPGHKPSRAMENYSGLRLSTAAVTSGSSAGIVFRGGTAGWDSAPDPGTYGGNVFDTGGAENHLVALRLRAPEGVDLEGVAVTVEGLTVSGNVATTSEALAKAYFQRDSAGWYLSEDIEVQTSSWPRLGIGLKGYTGSAFTFGGVSGEPALTLIRVHDTITIEKDNRFPLAGNLPDIKQWDFVASCLALFGLVPVIQGGVLHLCRYDEVLSKADAYDWTAKVDMSGAKDLSYALDGWARDKVITYVAEDVLPFDPTVHIDVEDQTLPARADYYALPYAASLQGNALHYKVTEKDGVAETEDIDIAPRIFTTEAAEDGTLQLVFSPELRGEGLAQRHYAALQEVVRKPLRLSADIRLNELDLAQLDLRRPVYLGQYGQYFAIDKIQTSGTDLCKVEFIQIP